MSSLIAGDSADWSKAPPAHFTGEVRMATLSRPDDSEGVLVLGVDFAPRARTDWHTHPGGQVLYIVSGEGLVVNRDGERLEVGPGDTVATPPDELHWHGAGPAGSMMHLSITSHGLTVWGEEKVTDEEYEH